MSHTPVANYHLMAAAPDLLAACEAAIDRLDEIETDLTRPERGMLRRARKLAKADTIRSGRVRGADHSLRDDLLAACEALVGISRLGGVGSRDWQRAVEQAERSIAKAKEG